MAWQKVKLGDIAIVTSSKRFHLSERSDSGVPFYCSKQIIQKVRGELVSDYDYIREEFYENVKKQYGVPEPGDLLITTRGSYGVPYIYKDNDKFYFADGNLTWLKDFKEDIDVRFLYYWICSYEGQKKIDAIAKGTAQKAVTIDGIKNLEISVPSFKTQKRIADILSAYDDLIENNQKQIKLLEEAAQRLYKQWFIDLRYPGHETTKIVDGLPKGWRKGIVGEIAEFKRGKVITKAQVAEGNVPVVAGGLEPAYYHNTANTTAPVITVSGSGANAGFAQLYNENVFASDCSFADINTTPYVYFVYCLLKDKKTELDSLQKGAAQPHVYAKDINALATLIPPEEMLKLYTKYASPYFEKIKALKEQIKNLTQSRDRLLPKLMNGELDV
ncbi:restriction endonuclease subunit S [Fibrobacter intestinalis]|uniref:Type I restriction enzyme, S subunit n=1 Tax=Fibrobacter intestinalis TaxID=28122 RepID=A0A1T4LTZ1_9BACT|nr:MULTISPECIES: restriction endonuclease subunit S [Fibrobacter]PBC75273.1 type I restriction enzyme S subunit [Fibrobacter sp. NR9]SJZ58111.1 type I restriction enzyme, S subunit [Fibrobacter intestinalis]